MAGRKIMGKRASLIGLLGLGLGAFGAYRSRRQLLARWFRLPPPQYKVVVERDLPVPMSDGTILRADHYAPAATGSFPTILVRTPYGRPSEMGVLGALQPASYALFAERGYHVVVQSVRGRFLSQGEFTPFINEAADGQATLEWITRQPWYNGMIGLWGASYLGYVQWAVATAPQVNALVPIITSSRFSQLFYQNGAFTLDASLRWSYMVHAMVGQDGRMDLDALLKLIPSRLAAAITPGLNHVPLNEADRVAVGHPVVFFQNWLANPDLNSPYWRTVDHPGATSTATAPIHLIAGWYDIFLRDQLADYARLVAAGRTPYLTVGPQYHLDFSIVVDGLREGLAWFDAHLKGDQSRLRQRPVRVYVMGAHEWHEMDYWPPPATITRYFLHAQQQLATDPPAATSPVDCYRYIPSDPTPVLGGPLLNVQGGPRDQRSLEARPDVLTYTSEPLAADLDVIGPVRLELYVRSSLPHTDFIGRLCDVHPDGQSINICDGLFRIEPGRGEPQPDGSLRIEIDMWATAQRFLKGHRIRLQVTSGAHPRWARNFGTGEPLSSATQMLPADQTIYHDAAHPSALVLPIVSR